MVKRLRQLCVANGARTYQAQQFNREMLEELFIIADAMEGVKPGSDESKMLAGRGNHCITSTLVSARHLASESFRTLTSPIP